MSFALARKAPSISFIVQDLKPVVAAAQAAIPSDVADRVKFMEYNFLSQQRARPRGRFLPLPLGLAQLGG